jgi:hypothetical protein
MVQVPRGAEATQEESDLSGKSREWSWRKNPEGNSKRDSVYRGGAVNSVVGDAGPNVANQGRRFSHHYQ